MTHLQHTTFPPGVPLAAIPWTDADLVPDTLTLLPTDSMQGKHQNCTHSSKPS